MNRNPLFHLHHIGRALLPALFLASCSQEELDGAQGEPLPPGQYPLELTAGGLEAAPVQASLRGTFEGNWDGVDGVRIRINDEEKKYVVKSSRGTSASLVGDGTDNTFYWTSTSEQKSVTALAPYSYGLDEANCTFTLPEVWTKEDLAKYDIIGATKPISYGDENKNLDFRHLLTKVVVNLKGENFSEGDNITVDLPFMYLTGQITNQNGDLCVEQKQDGLQGSPTAYRLPELGPENATMFEKNGAWEMPFASFTALTLPDPYDEWGYIINISINNQWYSISHEDLKNYISRDPTTNPQEAGKTIYFNITFSSRSRAQAGENSRSGETDDSPSRDAGQLEIASVTVSTEPWSLTTESTDANNNP